MRNYKVTVVKSQDGKETQVLYIKNGEDYYPDFANDENVARRIAERSGRSLISIISNTSIEAVISMVDHSITRPLTAQEMEQLVKEVREYKKGK